MRHLGRPDEEAPSLRATPLRPPFPKERKPRYFWQKGLNAIEQAHACGEVLSQASTQYGGLCRWSDWLYRL